MKKKSFGLAAAVAVLIVLGGSYTLLANHNRIQESESAAAESETGVAVATIASDKVSSFQLADGDTSFTLTKTDNSWICVQDETFPLSNDAASELVNTFTSSRLCVILALHRMGKIMDFRKTLLRSRSLLPTVQTAALFLAKPTV